MVPLRQLKCNSFCNDVLDGGLGKGELGVAVAPAGIGKTWLLIAIAAHAIIAVTVERPSAVRRDMATLIP